MSVHSQIGGSLEKGAPDGAQVWHFVQWAPNPPVSRNVFTLGLRLMTAGIALQGAGWSSVFNPAN